ncbi:ATP-binding cassette domain-containing protein [Gayadomonas joobiniege]|uniref:ATP-binding cassette domain-containing protein n=1 Tax=Gayadomonas joobiniege TaxID=1234606 RepID=UPI00037366FE|nr:ATP-binding cassette domain-containing protein [Gayadomonas joobiniege]
MINIKSLCHPQLNINHWQLNPAECAVVFGLNGAGKQLIDQLLTGKFNDFKAEAAERPTADKVALISFEAQQKVYEHELKIDQSDITNEVDPGTLAKDFLPQDALDNPLIDQLNLRHRMHTGYRQLSTGEGRKLLILQAILNGCELLVCDNPFDSLDTASCQNLSETLHQLVKQGLTLVLLLSNQTDIPNWPHQLYLLNHNQLDKIENNDSQSQILASITQLNQGLLTHPWPKPLIESTTLPTKPLVEIKNAAVVYDGKAVFSDINLTIQAQQHTLITGANGSGKSTLAQLITGDCPQCFSNHVKVFGYLRGNGETIWDIKKHLGIVSSELHRSYRVSCSVLEVVLSGLYDSIGIYQQPSQPEINLARAWLNKIGLADKIKSSFKQLSYGEQRLVLIARGLIKSPLLLVLDEPTQGLDQANRALILHFLQQLEAQQHSTILLISHREDEHLPLFKQRLAL